MNDHSLRTAAISLSIALMLSFALSSRAVDCPSLTINALDHGWYDFNGEHGAANNNYFCGEAGGSGGAFRNWFAFDIPVLTQAVASAELRIFTYDIAIPGNSEVFELRQVVTPVATLRAGGSGLTNIYNDLGNGTLFGSRTLLSAENQNFVSISLNAAFLAELNAASGGTLAVGGQIASLDGNVTNNEYLFGASGMGTPTNASVQLLLTYSNANPLTVVREPTSLSVPSGDGACFQVAVCGGGKPTFQWQRGSSNLFGATQPFLQLVNVTPASAGSYRVLVTDGSRTVTSAVATLTVSGGTPPSGYIYVNYGYPPVLAGSSFSLCASISGLPTPTLQWQLNGNKLPGETNYCLYAANVQTNQSGSYRVIASNSSGSFTSAPIAMVIQQAPPSGFIYIPGTSNTPPAGSFVTFCSVINGGPPPTLQWRLNGLNLPGETNSCLYLSNVQSNNSGNYQLVASNVAGVFTSAPVALTVIYSPPGGYLYFSEGRSPAQAGSYVAICSATYGAPAPDVQWQRNGVNLPLQTNACLVFSSVSSNDAGSYRLIATNVVGAFTSAPIALAVSYYAPTGAAYFANGQSPAPAGSSVTLCSTISGAPAPALQWQRNGANIPGANSSCLLLSNLASNDAGSYRLVASNALGVLVTAPLSLAVDYIAPYGSIYPSGEIPPQPAGSYFVICSTISGAPIPAYQWQLNGTNLQGQTGSCLNLTGAQTNQSGSYRLIAMNVVGSFTSEVAVVTILPKKPTVDIYLSSGQFPAPVGSYLTLCSTVSSSPAATLQWQLNGTNLPGRTASCLTLSPVQTNHSGAYTLVASNLYGATTSRVAMIEIVEPAPLMAFFTYLTPVAVGGYQYVCALSTLPSVTALQWRFNGTNLPGYTNWCFSIDNVRAEDAGEYSVVAITTNAVAITSAPITLTTYYVPPKQALPLFALGSSLALVGADVSLRAYYSGSPCFIQWRFNGVDLPGQTNAYLALLSITTNQAGQYSFTATNPAGMATSSVATITVRYQAPMFQTQPSSQSVAEGSTTRFAGYASAGPPATHYLELNGTNVPVPYTYEGCCGASSGGFSLFDTAFADAGNYRIIASNSLGVVTSSVASLTVTRAGPLDRWTQRNPLPQSQPLLAVAHGTNQFVAVGERGTILTSSNGTNWSLQSRRADVLLNGVAYGNGVFVAVGESGTILSSPDGTNWAYRYTSPNAFLNAVTHANGRFVAVGTASGLGTLVMLSTNGVQWDRVALGNYYAGQCIAYGNGLFVAGGGNYLMTSANGTNWTPVQYVTRQIESVTYANGLFVAVGDDGTTLVSAEGTLWLARTPVTVRRLLGVTYGAGRYVAVGARGTMLTSLNGVAWTELSLATPDRLETIDFAGGMFVAAGENGTIITSTNGTAWTKRNIGITRDLDGMVAANGTIMIVGKGGSILTSEDGTHYTIRDPGLTNDLHGVTWGGGLWVAVGEPGIIVTSPDGVHWTNRPSGNTNSLKDATYANGQWIAVGTQGTVVRSTNGIDWATTYTSPPYDLNDVAYGNGVFLIAADGQYNQNGSLYRSIDGRSWTRASFNPGKNLRGIIFTNGQFLITGNDGYVFRTTDGLSFYSTTIASFYGNLRAATWAHGLWIAVGNSGLIATSPDLNTWTRRASRTFENQHQVALLDGKLVVIGNRGTVLQSGRFVTELAAPEPVPGGLRLGFKGAAEQEFRLQASTNLLNWIPVSTNWTTGENGEFIDPDAWQHPQRFYRVVEP